MRMKMKWCMDKRSKWRRRRNKALCKLLTSSDDYFYMSSLAEQHKFYRCTPAEHYRIYEIVSKNWRKPSWDIPEVTND